MAIPTRVPRMLTRDSLAVTASPPQGRMHVPGPSPGRFRLGEFVRATAYRWARLGDAHVVSYLAPAASSTTSRRPRRPDLRPYRCRSDVVCRCRRRGRLRGVGEPGQCPASNGTVRTRRSAVNGSDGDDRVVINAPTPSYRLAQRLRVALTGVPQPSSSTSISATTPSTCAGAGKTPSCCGAGFDTEPSISETRTPAASRWTRLPRFGTTTGRSARPQPRCLIGEAPSSPTTGSRPGPSTARKQ